MTDDDKRRRRFADVMTLYGRKPVMEVLRDADVDVFRVHLATSNAASDIIERIEALAAQRHIEIVRHSRRKLSRISKNARQDQGVAADVRPRHYQSVERIPDTAADLLAVDGITNPRNLGMIIRSIAASPMDGLVLPGKGCAKTGPLVHKASAGTLLRSNVYHCPTLAAGIRALQARGFMIIGLAPDAATRLNEPHGAGAKRLYIVGNETTGLSEETRNLCDRLVSIPLARQVESINVAAVATLVAFRSLFSGRIRE